MTNRKGWGLFLMGVFSMTQIRVIGSIGISELFAFIVAPFVLSKEWPCMKRTKSSRILILSVLTCIGCIISSGANHTFWLSAIKGFASAYAIFALLVVYHLLLRKNLEGMKWYLVGSALSIIINTFVFQTAVETRMYSSDVSGIEASEAIMSGTLYWVNRLTAWLTLPIRGWYLQTPWIYSWAMPVALGLFGILTTESGRSAALTKLMGAVLVFIGGRSPVRFRFMQKNLVIIVLLGLCCAASFKFAYSWMAQSGMLTEKARQKLEDQTKGGRAGLLGMLMGGRCETFCGFYACLDKPIIGHGPSPIDTGDYHRTFLREYGNAEDYEKFCKDRETAARYGITVFGIPAHSYLAGFWMYYGIFGLLFWLYVINLASQCLRKYLLAIPQWFAILALGIPNFAWDVFFSPFTSRPLTVFWIASLLMIRAVGQGRLVLPLNMEIMKQKFLNGRL